MNPLDQENLIGAYESHCTAKVQNKFDIEGSILKRLMEFSYSVPDFRRSDKGNIRHRLTDIIILMILGRASGHVGRTAIIEFGRHNLHKFRKIGLLSNGVPSEATLCRVEQGIDNLAFADRMQARINYYLS